MIADIYMLSLIIRTSSFPTTKLKCNFLKFSLVIFLSTLSFFVSLHPTEKLDASGYSILKNIPGPNGIFQKILAQPVQYFGGVK